MDTDVLLDVLGNETRRRILNLISHEPMYFNQLAKEIQTGQQAILRHVKILEDSGLIKSYSMRSDLGAPDRKYYRVNSSFNISISVSNDNFTVRNEDHVGHVMKETANKIVVFGHGDNRFDIPKSRILTVGRNVILDMNFPEISDYKIDRNAPLPNGEPVVILSNEELV